MVGHIELVMDRFQLSIWIGFLDRHRIGRAICIWSVVGLINRLRFNAMRAYRENNQKNQYPEGGFHLRTPANLDD